MSGASNAAMGDVDAILPGDSVGCIAHTMGKGIMLEHATSPSSECVGSIG